MTLFSNDPQTSFLLFSAACLFVGIFFGISLSAFGIKKKIKKAVDKVKNEAEKEKMDIAVELNTQLVQVKESIIKTVEAYSSVAKTIQEKLPTPPEFKTISKNDNDSLRLEVIPGNSKVKSGNNEIESSPFTLDKDDNDNKDITSLDTADLEKDNLDKLEEKNNQAENNKESAVV